MQEKKGKGIALAGGMKLKTDIQWKHQKFNIKWRQPHYKQYPTGEHTNLTELKWTEVTLDHGSIILHTKWEEGKI